jgi:hypothetical protein
MTQDEIIEMARQAGIIHPEMVAIHLEAFAKLVAQHEREACIKAIEEQIGWDIYDPQSTATKVIRARGQA